MKSVVASITIHEMAEILRREVEMRLRSNVETIVITSYEQPRISIEFETDSGGDAMVESIEFKHRTGPMREKP